MKQLIATLAFVFVTIFVLSLAGIWPRGLPGFVLAFVFGFFFGPVIHLLDDIREHGWRNDR